MHIVHFQLQSHDITLYSLTFNIYFVQDHDQLPRIPSRPPLFSTRNKNFQQRMKKAEVVLIPLPAMGHIVAVVEM
jgi:hypothetical protein